MKLIEHARAHSPLKPSYPGSYGRYGGRHPRRFWRRPYGRRHYDRRHYYRQQPVYVIQETPSVPVSHWWYPSTWYHSLFYEGFQNERNMNCAMLSVLSLLILIAYCSKKK